MNLFLATRSLATSRTEDHLTEFFAASLELSDTVRQGFAALCIDPFAKANGWGSCRISGIQTQHCFDGTTCRPDMLLTLDNGKIIACEHKLGSPETFGPESDERAQLERYLDLPIDGLIYVRSMWKPPSDLILRHPRYIRPAAREHFIWADFYPLFEQSEDLSLSWMKEAFETLGFVPPHPWVGKLETKAERRNFAEMWGKMRSLASEMGWIGAGSITELYLSDNSKTDALWIYIRPSPTHFLFRATPKPYRQSECFRALAAASHSSPYPVDHGGKSLRRTGGDETVYEIKATAAQVLGEGPWTTEALKDRMCDFVAMFLRALKSG